MDIKIKEWLEKKIKKSKEKEDHKTKKRNSSNIHFDNKPNLEKKIKLKGQKVSSQKFFENFFKESNVAKRAFWPYIHFTKTENRYKKNLTDKKKIGTFKPKDREIFYASYFDGFIYSYYNFLLDSKYEKLLEKSKLNNEILAYRHISRGKSKGGKNNIYFAKEIFEEIHQQQNCYVFAFDISKFFDRLDWNILKENLCLVLGVKDLNKDWTNIFNSITKYSYIDREILDEYNLISKHKVDTKEFYNLRKTYKKSTGKNLVKKTPYYRKKYGIAQGTPISGMMANLYMYKFDLHINKFIQSIGGKYYRYCDDILIVSRYNKSNKINIYNEVKDEVLSYIKDLKLDIQQKKTEIFDFEDGELVESFKYDEKNKTFKKYGNQILLQYLGFSFDGKNIFLRSKTLGSHYKKMCSSLNRLAQLKPHIKNIKGVKITIRESRIKNKKIKLKDVNFRYTHLGSKINKGIYGNFYGYVKEAHNIMLELKTKLGLKSGIKEQMSKYGKNYKKIVSDKKLSNYKNKK